MAHGTESPPRSADPFRGRWLHFAHRLCERGESPGRTRYRPPEGTWHARGARCGAIASDSTATHRERSAFISWSRTRRASRVPVCPPHHYRRIDATAAREHDFG